MPPAVKKAAALFGSVALTVLPIAESEVIAIGVAVLIGFEQVEERRESAPAVPALSSVAELGLAAQ